MIVIDTSALIELLAGTSTLRERVSERVLLRQEQLHAPHLVDLEFLSGLRTIARRSAIALTIAERAFERFATLKITRYPHDALRLRVWNLRGNLTAYDASYVALAENLRIPLVTCDANLARAPGNTANIELIT